jgi:hypothetical protein
MNDFDLTNQINSLDFSLERYYICVNQTVERYKAGAKANNSHPHLARLVGVSPLVSGNAVVSTGEIL